jgi:O-antigen ligase
MMDTHGQRYKLNTFLGVLALYLFAFFAWVGVAGAYIGLGLMLLTFLLSAREAWPALRRDGVFLVFASLSVYLWLRAVWAAREFPGTEQFELALDWMHLAFFIFPAWWLGASTRRIAIVLVLVLLGLTTGIVRGQEWGQLSLLLSGERSGFGHGIPQMGLFSATAVWGMLILAPRLWGPPQRHGPFLIRLIVWATMLAVLLEVLIISQSRVSWIALLIVASGLIGYRIWSWGRGRPAVSWGRVAVVTALSVTLVAGLVLANFHTIRYRSLSEAEIVQAIVAGETAEVPIVSAVGARFHLTRHGLKAWLERPVFGWGPSTQVAEFAQKPLSDFGHLHNTYLEILARFGLVGALLLGAGIALMIGSLATAYRSGRLPHDYFLFILGAFGLLAIWSAANFRLSADWRFYWILFAALAYTFRLHAASRP